MGKKKTKIDETIRVDKKFKEWIEDIQRERLKRLIDTKKTSSRKLTSMIPKHNSSKRMKKDLINWDFEKDKQKR